MSVLTIGNNLFQTLGTAPSTPEDDAAIKIQSLFRGFRARGGLFGCGVKAIQHKQYEWYQKACAGKTPVYFHPGCPLVLKNCPVGEARNRRTQMSDAQKLCDRGGFDCLVIPRALVYQNWLMETRLPIAPKQSLQEILLDQIVLYSSNPRLFDEAVSQFGRFCCHTYFTDLCGGRSSFQIYAPGVDLPRYDNITLFHDVNSGKGKIALPDLEHCIVLVHSTPSEDDIEETLYNLIRLFPYHENQILQLAQQYLPNADLPKIDQKLMDVRKGILGFHKAFLNDRVAFLQDKEVTLADPRRICTFSKERLQNFRNALETELLFIDNPEIYVSALVEKMIQVLEDIAIKRFQNKPPVNIQQQLVLRDIQVSLDTFAMNCIPSVSGGLETSNSMKSMICTLLEEMAKKQPDGSFGELGFFHFHHENRYNNIPCDILQIFY